MPKNNDKSKDKGSDSESEKSKKEDSASEEEEEYVVEKVVDKRFVKNGKVCDPAPLKASGILHANFCPVLGRIFPEVEGVRRQPEHMGAKGESRLR